MAVRAPDLWVGELYTHTLGHGPEEEWIARETLADLLALASDRGRAIVRLRLEGGSNTEIGEQLGCTDRTVRRHLDELHRRACAAGILDVGEGPVLGVMSGEGRTASQAPLAKAA